LSLKYSGTMPLLSSLNICSFYCLVSWITCWYSTIVPPAGYSGTAQLAGGLLFAVGLDEGGVVIRTAICCPSSRSPM
jgi:hypothetical protein